MTRHVSVDKHFIDTQDRRAWFARGKDTMRLPRELTAAEAEEMQARSVERRQVAEAKLGRARKEYEDAREALKNAQGAYAEAVTEADQWQLWAVERREWKPDTPVQRFFHLPDRGQPVEVTVRMDPGYSSCEVGERRPLTAAEIDSVRQLTLPDADAPDTAPIVKAATVLAFAQALDDVEEMPDAIDNEEYQARAADNLAQALDRYDQLATESLAEAEAAASTRVVPEPAEPASLHAAIVTALTASDKGRLTLRGLQNRLPDFPADLIETMLCESASFKYSRRYWRLAVPA